jgi:precorrin-6A/cobalt-precorrin-6A reductase
LAAPFLVLILGGTTEAAKLAQALAGNAAYAPLLSLAGRTRAPVPPAIPARTGGFGGAEGLAAFLRENFIAAVIDATHPFAVNISANAAAACRQERIPLAILTRPAWTPAPGDRWIDAEDGAAAATALGEEPRTVLLAIGRQDLSAFRGARHHRYLVRSVDAVAPADLPAGARQLLARGPFDTAGELQLLRDERIDIVVSKNSGGDATYAKIAAARQLGLPVIMVRRPQPRTPGAMHETSTVLAWLDAQRTAHDTAS